MNFEKRFGEQAFKIAMAILFKFVRPCLLAFVFAVSFVRFLNLCQLSALFEFGKFHDTAPLNNFHRFLKRLFRTDNYGYNDRVCFKITLLRRVRENISINKVLLFP